DEILRFLTGKGGAAGRVENVRFLNDLLKSTPRIRLQGGAGTVEADLSLDRGHGTGSLRFSVDGAAALMTDAAMKGKAEGEVRLSGLDLWKGIADFSESRLEARDVVLR